MSLNKIAHRFRMLASRPFATALGFLLFASMVTTLSGLGLTADALEHLVPQWFLVGLSISYGVGGLLILAGQGWEKSNWEAAGCVLVFSGLAIRTIALLSVLGFTAPTLSTSVFYLVFGWACLERFWQILKGDTIIRVHRRVEIQFEGNDDDSRN